ncbi:MAG: hypothetical protein ACRD6I_16110 [Candidatus Acidiferrales bacterium]
MGKRHAKSRQNVTVSLPREIIRKAKILAARRETSISGLLAEQIEALISQDEAYTRAMRDALALLEKGFHMGGFERVDRGELHDRKALR